MSATSQVIDYIRKHPGATTVDIGSALKRKPGGIASLLTSVIRRDPSLLAREPQEGGKFAYRMARDGDEPIYVRDQQPPERKAKHGKRITSKSTEGGAAVEEALGEVIVYIAGYIDGVAVGKGISRQDLRRRIAQALLGS